ncbi:MAG: acyl-CoA thioesterase [Gordonia sp. (in: high G+C Gram-positive bacteria)]|uniref:acyl-CoA thioesterase n=1 Tax=Gordonia sp. (in: high G+C Gram-positive bacteria) TaxID=84139 RepID=UPI0039E6CE1F
MAAAERPTRSDYAAWDEATLRWADVDVYGHVNNARYFELIDTAVNVFLARESGVDIRRLPAIGVVAEVGCRYFREVEYPGSVKLGIRVERLGNSSIIYRVGIFPAADDERPADEAAAEGRFVHVYVDNTDPARPSVPIPAQIRGAVQQLVTR